MAKKFQFRLDVVRDMRKRSRDDAARVVAERLTQVAAVQQRVEDFSKQLRDTLKIGCLERAEKSIEVAVLKTQQYYGKWLHDRITDASSTLRLAAENLSQERTKLAQAAANLKAIEKLRERKWRKHLLLVRRDEQAMTDEVAGRMGQAAKVAEAGVSA
jgi:flagellar export protein FliJ